MMKLLCRYNGAYLLSDGVNFKCLSAIPEKGDNWYTRNNKIQLKRGSLFELNKGINYYTGCTDKLPENIRFVNMIDREFNAVAANIDYKDNWVSMILKDIVDARYIDNSCDNLFERIDGRGVFDATHLASGVKVLLLCDYLYKIERDRVLMLSTTAAGDNVIKLLLKYVSNKPIILYDPFELFLGDMHVSEVYL